MQGALSIPNEESTCTSQEVIDFALFLKFEIAKVIADSRRFFNFIFHGLAKNKDSCLFL